MRFRDIENDSCAIAQSLGVVGDWWTLLIVREIAGGHRRFDAIQRELGVSRKVLAERLHQLVDERVIETRPYSEHPPRNEYELTASGRALIPVLVALQNWGGQYVLGDGELSATTTANSPEAARVRSLVGTALPEILLDSTDGRNLDPVGPSRWTVLYAYPGAYPPAIAYPPGWSTIPGARGCTLESRTFRDRLDQFVSRGATVHGVSTQRVDELAAFSEFEQLGFGLLSDADGLLATALRLPTFRAGGRDRLKRATLVLDSERIIRWVGYPISDPVAAVDEALDIVGALDEADSRTRAAS